MESDMNPLSSTSEENLATCSAQHVTTLLGRAGLEEPPRIATLTDQGLPKVCSRPANPNDEEAARSLLVEERIFSLDYRAPEEQKRNTWLRVTAKQKEAAQNRKLWVFNKHEVARTFNCLLSRTPLPSASIAQAVLSHARNTSLEELWYHLHDPKLEESMDKWYKKRRYPLDSQSIWLNHDVQHLDMDYVRLLCWKSPGQASLDLAFGSALSMDSKDAMQILLCFGATASMCENNIRERMKLNDVPLAKLLLSAPTHSMSISAWRNCLEPQVEDFGQGPSILLLCLSHRPGVACEYLLIHALRLQHLAAVAVLLAYYAVPPEGFEDFCRRTSELASLVVDHDKRLAFFELLKETKLLFDSPGLRIELYKDVEARHIPLVRLLVDVGVTLDAETGANVMRCVVSRIDFTALDFLVTGVISQPISTALSYAPDSTSETDMLRLVRTLALRGLQGIELDRQLVRAARKEHTTLAIELLLHGASATYGNGAAFSQAAQRCNLPLLSILYQASPPNSMISEAVGIAFEAVGVCGYDQALAAIKLLLGWGANGTPLHRTLAIACSKDHRLAIVKVLVQKGANANYNNGACFYIALLTQNLPLLQILCADSPPSRVTTETVLSTAINPKHYSLQAMDVLLKFTRSASAALDASWDSEKLRGNPNLNSIVPCWLRHGLDVNLGDGVVVCFVVREMNSPLLEHILAAAPSIASLSQAFQVALNLKSRVFGQTTMAKLLQSAKSAEIGQSRALTAQTTTAILGCSDGLEMMLRYGADVNFNDGEVVRTAAVLGCNKVLALLVRHGPSIPTLKTAFLAAAASSTLAASKQQRVFKCLLNADGASLAEFYGLSRLLCDSVTSLPQSPQLPAFLIERGALVHMKVLKAALPTSSQDMLKILVAAVSNTVASDVFRAAVKMTMSPARKHWTYEILLARHEISTDATTKALNDALFHDAFDISIVKLLVTSGADPNMEAALSFRLAAKAKAETTFRLLSPYAKLSIVLRVLLDSCPDEGQVLFWFGVCLEELPSGAVLDDQQLLYHSMSKFPQGSELVHVLLDNGLSASTKMLYRICWDLPRELCTPLIWALFTTPSVSNDAVLALLAHSALPRYSTESSGVSAALGCLLEKTRTPVLEALLSLEGGELHNYRAPRTTLARLAAKSRSKSNPDGFPHERVDLQQASTFLGNLESYKLLAPEQVPNDGTLHFAALLALPRFVEWLLPMHDPNFKHSDYDQMIPLAIACQSSAQPYTKIADQEAKFRRRRKDTIRLLAAKTDIKWRYRGKTVLHVAMEQGLDVTKELAEALDLHRDRERDNKYLYRDKDGVEYSPDQWAILKMEVGTSQYKKELKTYFLQLGVQSRLFKRILPGGGEQPEGYCGLPPVYAAAWDPPLSDMEEGHVEV